MTTIVYPFDPTGVAGSNLIVNEQQSVSFFKFNGSFLIIPYFAPFFGVGLTVIFNDGINPTRTLIEGIDFNLIFPYWGATRSIGVPIHGGILLASSITTGTIQLQYQVLGGNWVCDQTEVFSKIALLMNDYRFVIWDVVSNITDCFPPINNSLIITSTDSLDSLNVALLGLAAAIANSPSDIINFDLNSPIIVTGEYAPLVNNVIPAIYLLNLHTVYVSLNSSGLINTSMIPDLSSLYAALTSNGTISINEISDLSKLYAALTSNGTISISEVPDLSSLYAALSSNNTVSINEIPNLSTEYAPLVNGLVPCQYLSPCVDAYLPTVNGPKTLGVGTTGTYTITNFSDFINYNITAISGTVSINKDIITYTAPSTDILSGFIINGITVSVNAILLSIVTPSITNPVTGTTNISIYDLIFDASVFTMSSGTDTQASASWELATDSTFTTIVQSSMASATNLTSWTVTGLTINTTYYIRVLYIGIYGESSAYSSIVSFTTISNIIATPSIISPITGSTGMTVNNLLLTSSVFTLTSGTDTQVSASWELATDSGFSTIVQSSMVSTTNLTSWTVTSLVLDTVYYARVLYTGVAGESSAYSSTVSFTTEISSLPTSIIGELTATNGAAYDGLSFTIALNSTGTIAIIGTNGKTIGSNAYQGAAYIFQDNAGTWTQIAELLASDGAAYDMFGRSVAINSTGTIAIIGAPDKTVGSYSGQGAAYIFQVNSSGVWTQIAELASNNGASNDYFGYSTSINSTGNTVIIGAYGKTIGSNANQGAAYIFQDNAGAWTQIAELTSNNGAAGDEFGWSVALDATGTTVIVGAWVKTISSIISQGAAYIFQLVSGVWTQMAELTASNGAAYDHFGQSVSINSTGTVAIIGAFSKTINAVTGQGAAYIFQDNAGVWTQIAELTATNGAANDYFGKSVALDATGTTAIIGAFDKTVGSNSAQGAAYIFQLISGVWTQMTELTATNGAANDNFGYSVAIDAAGDIVIIGAYNKTIGSNVSQGAVYIA